ncbi:hypothetical protein HL653_14915 [Sphingomonas sp. AP4-R1]|uniref:hypothetical protein n=1 Tax=Sphingomonas sp. AP4-R1 TaxID=2735134 RepID=UPI001493968A|nr:hypothetical protein [Sphingomonas sp. AP4-R1]QJU58888.1 hypothetical protein HL653_14915 [Sphingomonas sp. AP4-R1]
MKKFLVSSAILFASALSTPSIAGIAAEQTKFGYYFSDERCYDWKGPNGVTYSVVWVGRTNFLDCGGGSEVFSDIFHQSSFPLPDYASFATTWGGPYASLMTYTGTPRSD